MQFEHAEFEGAAPGTLACASCRGALPDAYYTVNGQPACERCQLAARHAHEHGHGSSGLRFARATAFGLGAALAGTLLWYAVRRLTGYEVGLIAILVGFMVGSAVRAGSYGRGGWRYQTLAMLLTYASIVSNYVPDIVTAIGEQQRTGSAVPAVTPSVAQLVLSLVLLFALACAAPFLAGFQNIMGLIIIGIALYEAWKRTRRAPLEIAGPFRVGSAPAAVETTPAPIAPQ